MSTPSLLTSLLDLITTATHDLQSELTAAGLPEPWIDHPALHPWDEETPSKKYWEARRVLVSALGMMTAVVQNPREKVVSDGMGHHHPAAFNFVVRTGIPDILAAPDVDERVGLHVDEIARRAGTHPAKTERVLRFLCIHHMFQETSPSVFANNKTSHCLKADQPNSGPPIFWGDLAFRGATALSRTLRDPETAHSLLVQDSSFSHVITDEPAPVSNGVNGAAKESPTQPPKRVTVFEFLARPSSAMYREAFGRGMHTLEIMNGQRGYLDFDWSRWDTAGALFVEAGASTGHLALSVLPVVKHAKFINQDLPEVCADGEKFFLEKNPKALQSGRVVFQPNDFFTGQPVKGAPIYILSNILHDWPEAQGMIILNHIAAAMSSTSRLLVIEIVIVPAISQSRSMPAATHNVNDAPWPLLKDYGLVNRYAHHQSMELLNLFNSLDRTLDEYVAMFDKAGLELVQVHRIRKLVSIMELKKKAE